MAETKRIYDASGNLVREEVLTSMPLTEGEMILARRAHNREMLSTLGAAGAAGAAQMGLSFVNTQQDVRNKAQLEELKRREQAGLLGTDTKEDAFLEATLMNPVRTLATQQTQRGEAERASMGATRSARDVLQAQKAERQVVAGAAQQAGLKKAERFFQRKAAEAQELEQRTAYESERAKNRLEMLGNTIAGLAGLAGKYMAASVKENVTAEQLNEFLAKNPELKGKSTTEILNALKQSQRATAKAKEEAEAAARYGGVSGGGAEPGTAGADNFAEP